MLKVIEMSLVVLACCLSTSSTASESVEYPRLADQSGCVIEQITSSDFNEYQVYGVSPDSEWLSMAWDKGEDADGNPIRGAYNLNLRSGEIVELQDPLNNSGSFSRDGRFLVGAQYTDNGRTDIYEQNLTTGETNLISPHENGDWLPSYSPNGQFIVFNSYRIDRQAEIFLYERATGNLTRLTHHDGYDAHAQFSPDGKQIIFHRMNSVRESGGYDFDLIAYDLETGEEKRLTTGPYEESYAAFAPDGHHIAFSSDFDEAPEQSNLYVLGSDGEIVRQLTDGDWKDSYSYWTPDGKFIYFNSDRSGSTSIYRIPMIGLDCERG